MPSRFDREDMALWLSKNRIVFEVEHDLYRRQIIVLFIDKKNNCILASKTYPWTSPTGNVAKMRKLILNFQLEEVNPLLFGYGDRDLTKESASLVRLIRDD